MDKNVQNDRRDRKERSGRTPGGKASHKSGGGRRPDNPGKTSSGYGPKGGKRPADDGFWITDPVDGSRMYVKGHGPDREIIRVPKGTGGDTVPTVPQSASAGPVPTGIPNAMIKFWRRNGRCLGCGSEQHRVAQCTAGPSTPTGSPTSASVPTDRAKQASQSGKTREGSGPKAPAGKSATNKVTLADTEPRDKGPQSHADSKGQKRKRSVASATGQTPPPKKQATKKFEYARAAENAVELAIVLEDKGHISRKDFNNLRDAADKLFLEQLEKGETDLISVETWSYSSTLATVNVTDDKSRSALESVAEKLKLRVVDMAQLKAERRPVKILSGLLTGPAAKHPNEVLGKLLKFEADRMKITGRLQIASSVKVPRSGNLLLRILVDDVAEERLKEISYELRFGAAGKTRFEDLKSKHSVNSKTRQEKLDRVVQEIEAGKKKISSLCRQRKQIEDEMDLEEALPNVEKTKPTPKPTTVIAECKDYLVTE